jgi:signal peptidase I
MLQQTAEHWQVQPVRILAEPSRRARGHLRVATVLSSVLLAAVLVLILILVAGMALGMWRFTVVDTGSMRPTLNPGDVAVLTSERPASLREGQIVAFHPPGKTRLTVIHRVFSLHRSRDAVIMRTKGDANNAVDPWRARIVGNTVWREYLKVPKLGYLAVWSQQRAARLTLLVLIVVLIASMLLSAIWRPTSR